MLKSEDKEPKKDEESSGKVPSGFEKLLKRSKRGASKTEGSEKQKGEEKDKEEKDKDEEAESKEEGDNDGKEKKSSNTHEDAKKLYSGLMFDPNSGGPRWDNWLMMALIGATGAYYISQSKPRSREITYQEMVQNYL